MTFGYEMAVSQSGNTLGAFGNGSVLPNAGLQR